MLPTSEYIKEKRTYCCGYGYGCSSLDGSCRRTAIDVIAISSLLNLIPVLIYMYKNKFLLSTLIFLTSMSSYAYHITYEQSVFFERLDMSLALSTYCFFAYDFIFILQRPIFYGLWSSLCIFFYWNGTGRHEYQQRSKKYEIYHLIWHICLWLMALHHSLESTISTYTNSIIISIY